MYDKLIEEFQGSPVFEFNQPEDWNGTGVAYRLREEYDDELKLADRLHALLAQPGCDQVASLIIGAWSNGFEGEPSKEVVDLLVKSAGKLPGLKHLFLGEMTFEECEVSWINQSDLSPLLKAFPKLESFRVRGGTGLAFSKIKHDNLRELAVETGGLPRATIRQIFLCEFPALEHLELLLGESHYGFDGGVEDLQPLLSGRLFPNLKWLGLMNSEIADEIAAVVVNAPIVERLQSLDLSLGNLDSEGVQSLKGLAAFPNLKTLNISHYYAGQSDVAELKKALKCQVIAEDKQDWDEWRPIVHAE